MEVVGSPVLIELCDLHGVGVVQMRRKTNCA